MTLDSGQHIKMTSLAKAIKNGAWTQKSKKTVNFLESDLNHNKKITKIIQIYRQRNWVKAE